MGPGELALRVRQRQAHRAYGDGAMLTRHALCFRGAGHCAELRCTGPQFLTRQLLREGGMPDEEARELSKLCPRWWPFGGAAC